ncbi:MAG TPA: DUF3006 domain-containing protein [Planococcus sp. (in: firmicutes)]|nr:DUF3006 domain-containing protein [Planococcus sp. (in: firmicutes)]
MKGMLDRIEDGCLAVILIEELQREIVLPAAWLPEGSRVNSWFDIELDGQEIKSIALDAETAAAKEDKAAGLMRRLKAKRNKSRFKRDE